MWPHRWLKSMAFLCQSVIFSSDNFHDQMKRELSYREEMVQQLHIVRGETNKAKGADTAALRHAFIVYHGFTDLLTCLPKWLVMLQIVCAYSRSRILCLGCLAAILHGFNLQSCLLNSVNHLQVSNLTWLFPPFFVINWLISSYKLNTGMGLWNFKLQINIRFLSTGLGG